MKRYELVPYERASDAVRALYDDYLRTTGEATVPLWVQSLGTNPDLLRAYWERAKGSLARGSLPALLKEMVIFVVSVENGSRYCSACHAHAVLRMDATLKFEDLKALVDPQAGLPGMPPAFRAALALAQRIARNANGVPDADFDLLHQAGYSEDEVRELLSVIDLAVMFNAYTSALQLPLDPDYRAVLGQDGFPGV